MSDPVPLCKIARETGGDVPLACLFNCVRGCHDEDKNDHEGAPGEVTCKRCGEDGLEWLHTGVRWRLIGPDARFHVCSNDHAADDFEVLP